MIHFDQKSRLFAGITTTLALHAAVVLWLIGKPAAIQPPVVTEMEISISMASAPTPLPVKPPLPPLPQIKAVAKPAESPKPLRMTDTPVVPMAPPPVLSTAKAVAEAPVVDTPPPAAPTAPPPPPVAEIETIAPVFNAAYLQNPAPAYPALSRRLREQGKVVLRVHVCADGNADDVQVQHSSGYNRLDDAALNTVKRWRFKPAQDGDKAVAAWVIVPVNFNLES